MNINIISLKIDADLLSSEQIVHFIYNYLSMNSYLDHYEQLKNIGTDVGTEEQVFDFLFLYKTTNYVPI